MDEVKVTGVWASVSAVEHDQMAFSAIFELYPDIVGTPPGDAIWRVGGTGLRPLDPVRGMENVILIQFTVAPSGVQILPDRYLDGARRCATALWYWFEGQLLPGFPLYTNQPVKADFDNDDGTELDESAAVTSAGHFYTMDSPGFTAEQLALPIIDEARYWLNAAEYLRFSTTGDIAGNGILGSRASEFYVWHCAHHISFCCGKNFWPLVG